MGPSFKGKIAKIRNYESHEQCKGPTQKILDVENFHFQCNSNVGFFFDFQDNLWLHPLESLPH